MTSPMLRPDPDKTVTEDAAIAAGYTRPVIADRGLQTLELLIKPETDLDWTFIAYDRDKREMRAMKGWEFDISPE